MRGFRTSSSAGSRDRGSNSTRTTCMARNMSKTRKSQQGFSRSRRHTRSARSTRTHKPPDEVPARGRQKGSGTHFRFLEETVNEERLTEYERGWIEAFIDAECALGMYHQNYHGYERFTPFLSSTSTTVEQLRKL